MTTDLTPDLVVDAVGQIDPERVAAIVASGASLDELLEAHAWVCAGESPAQSSGTVALLHAILTADHALWRPDR